ncbi:MAG: SDR family oxidoreductase [bacterium]
MTSSVFLTGATGFIGSSFLEELLAAQPDARITLLVRCRKSESPPDRMKRVLAELGPDVEAAFHDRATIVEGDVTLEDFGLTGSQYSDIARSTTHIVHCAAAVRFDLPLDEARAINLGGSQRVLALARACRSLSRLDYVGTAYVAGTRTGPVKEDDLDLGQAHHNTYEQTKMESESLMRRAMREVPLAIHRPSIVICDSRTGRISRYSAFHRMLAMYYMGGLTALPGQPSTLMDIVPVDYVARAIHAISRDAASLGKCFHLTAGPGRLTSLEEICDLAERHFGRPRLQIVPPEAFEASVRRLEASLSEEERDLLEEIRIYQPYLAGRLEFDNSNTRSVLGAGAQAPPLRDYFAAMASYVIRSCTNR